jgi:hypothetical protein
MDESNNTDQQPNTETIVPTETTPNITPEAPVTTPETPPVVVDESLAVAPGPTPENKPKKSPLILVVAVLVALVVGVAGGYLLGTSNNKKNQVATKDTKTTEVADVELAIPQGATVIAQCAKGRGTQYALPKDIPLGPVYNVHEGKVIGIEFMVGKDELLGTAKNFLDLPLYNKKFDHVNIGLLSQGHAGFPTPHYHVDVMMVPTSVTDKITCTT